MVNLLCYSDLAVSQSLSHADAIFRDVLHGFIEGYHGRILTTNL